MIYKSYKKNYKYDTLIKSAPLVKGGPEIPEELFKSHQEGNLVIFCGAGISMKLGLGNFNDLLIEMQKSLNYDFKKVSGNSSDDTIYKLSSLEMEHNHFFRSKLRDWGDLRSKNRKRNKRDFSTHKALVELSQSIIEGEIVTRLVTTNFDNAFEIMRYSGSTRPDLDIAPKLPDIRLKDWNSIVHLHGGIVEGSRIIVTDDDFGMAYITQGWASRFVIDLFYRYDVLFIGYSAQDPVIRYLIRALESEKITGFPNTRRFVITSERSIENWKPLSTEIISYQGINNHAKLHSTIKIWRDIHVGKIDKFQEISLKHSANIPDIDKPLVKYILIQLFTNPANCSSPFVYRINQKENKGKEIRYPNFEWWSCLSQMEEQRKADNKNYRGLVNIFVLKRDEVEREGFVEYEKYHRIYQDWFLSMMDNDALKYWVLERGTILHPELNKEIVSYYSSHNGRDIKQKDRTFWEYLIFNRDLINPSSLKNIYYRSHEELDLQRISEILKIYINIEYDIFYDKSKDFKNGVKREYVIRGGVNDDSLKLVNQYIENCYDENELKSIFNIISNEFHKVVQSESYWAKDEVKYDPISVKIQSIKVHDQNYSHTPFTSMVYAWVGCIEGLKKVRSKYDLITPLFNSQNILEKRLVLHFLCDKDLFDIDKVKEYLYSKDNRGIIWEDDYKREWYRLIYARWDELDIEMQTGIIDQVLKGPTKKRYANTLEEERRNLYLMAAKVDKLRWFKYRGVALSKYIEGKIDEALADAEMLYPKYFNWDIPTKLELEQLEFNGWMYPVRDVPTKSHTNHLHEIHDVDELIEKIVKDESRREPYNEFQSFDYEEWLNAKNADALLNAIERIAQIPQQDMNELCINVMGKFFESISSADEKLLEKNKNKLISILTTASDEVYRIKHYAATRLLSSMLDKSEVKLEDCNDIWDRLFDFASSDITDNNYKDYVSASLNSSAGILCNMLFIDNLRNIKDIGEESVLSERIKSIWDKTQRDKNISDKNRHIIYGIYGKFLYHISELDMDWLKDNIIPVLKKLDEYSMVIWNGYLYNPLVSHNLLLLLKKDLLKISEKLIDIDRVCITNYIRVILYAIIYVRGVLTPYRFRLILHRLDKEHKEICLDRACQALSENYLNDSAYSCRAKVVEWFNRYWPLADEYLSSSYNTYWISLIIKIPDPNIDDFNFIASMLKPATDADCYLDIYYKDIPIKKEYLLLFAVLLSEGVDCYIRHDVEKIIEVAQAIKKGRHLSLNSKDTSNYEVIKDAVKTSGKYYKLWADN